MPNSKPYHMRFLILGGLILLLNGYLIAQAIPSTVENIQYLVTFSKEAEKKWGDDDHVQTFFFLIPEEVNELFYIRIYDPDIGGSIDQPNGSFNSKTKFSVYGGKGAHSGEDARKIDPVGNYKSGISLAQKTFGNEKTYDQKWYSFGPFNPKEGEYNAQFKGHIFKVIAEGLNGNDGNLYSYFLSTSENENRPVEGGNGFTYEYSFRLFTKANEKAHLYPFIDDKVKYIKQYNFDFDQDGHIKVFSVSKNGHIAKGSQDDNWAVSEHQVVNKERGKSYDLQIIKPKEKLFNNDMVMYVVNEYDEAVPFFAVPIGGPPKFNYVVKVKLMYGDKKH